MKLNQELLDDISSMMAETYDEFAWAGGASVVVDNLEKQGFDVSSNGCGGLVVSPRANLTSDQVEMIKAKKSEILALLEDVNSGNVGDTECEQEQEDTQIVARIAPDGFCGRFEGQRLSDADGDDWRWIWAAWVGVLTLRQMGTENDVVAAMIEELKMDHPLNEAGFERWFADVQKLERKLLKMEMLPEPFWPK